MNQDKLRVAWFSDIAEDDRFRSVQSYYSYLLLPHLDEQFSIEIFSRNYRAQYVGIPHHHYLTAYQRHREKPFDIFFYQLEDGYFGRDVRTQIGMMPGVTWIHDLFLNDRGAEGIHISAWRNTIRQLRDADESNRANSIPMSFDTSWAQRETLYTPVLLFSSSWMHDQYRTLSSSYCNEECNYQITDILNVPLDLTRDSEAKKREDRGTFELLSFRGVGTGGRMHKALPALKRLLHPWRLTWVVDSEDFGEVDNLIHEYNVQDKVKVVNDTSPQTWAQLLKLCDVALHLGNPKVRQSPFVNLSIASSVPVLMRNYGVAADFCGQSLFLIDSGTKESYQIFSILDFILRNDIRGELSSLSECIEASHDSAKLAKDLSKKLFSVAPYLKDNMARYEQLKCEAGRGLGVDLRKRFSDMSVATQSLETDSTFNWPADLYTLFFESFLDDLALRLGD